MNVLVEIGFMRRILAYLKTAGNQQAYLDIPHFFLGVTNFPAKAFCRLRVFCLPLVRFLLSREAQRKKHLAAFSRIWRLFAPAQTLSEPRKQSPYAVGNCVVEEFRHFVNPL